MIFSYWHGPIPHELPNVADWKSVAPDLRIFTDRDVLPIAAKYGADVVELFRRIRLPAARGDVARVLLLEAYGGMWVDFHVGHGQSGSRCSICSRNCAGDTEVVVIDELSRHAFKGDLALPSSVVLARKGAKPMGDIVRAVLRNLVEQFRKERESTEYVPYNTVVVTGPWAISVVLFDRSELPIVLRQQYRETVLTYAVPDDVALAPFR